MGHTTAATARREPDGPTTARVRDWFEYWSRIALILLFLPAVVLFPVPTLADYSAVGELPRRADPGFSTSTVDQRLSVAEVRPDSPASQAGLIAGDIIASINGQTYERGVEGRDMLRRLDGGEKTRLAVERTGSRRRFRNSRGSFRSRRLPGRRPADRSGWGPSAE